MLKKLICIVGKELEVKKSNKLQNKLAILPDVITDTVKTN